MILAALEELNGKVGSNKSAISMHMEGKYADLPPAHGALLTAHLARMKESGELLFLKNNYFRADAPDAPPKRGRGRPPKAKDPNAPPKPTSPPPRGRPAKSQDPKAEATNPPKKPKPAPAPAPTPSPVPAAADGSTRSAAPAVPARYNLPSQRRPDSSL